MTAPCGSSSQHLCSVHKSSRKLCSTLCMPEQVVPRWFSVRTKAVPSPQCMNLSSSGSLLGHPLPRCTTAPVNQHPPKEVSLPKLLFQLQRKAVRTARWQRASPITTDLATSDGEISKYAVLLVLVSCVGLQALEVKSHRTLTQLGGSFLV